MRPRVAGLRPLVLAVLATGAAWLPVAPLPVAPAAAANVGFVTRQGDRFVLDGAPFHFVGTNAYWMAIMTAMGSPAHADDQIALARWLGLTVMRTWGFSDGIDNDGVPEARALQPRPGVYNETAFRALDYVLYRADLAGIRLIIPLVNGNPSYGGAAQYVAWCAPGGGERAFYEQPACRALYRNYVSYVLNRRNTYNGRLYKEDPTVFAWELANEPHIADHLEPTGQVIRAWVAEMAAHVKAEDPNHLVGTGEEGYDVATAGYSPLAAYNGQSWLFDGTKGLAWADNTADPNIDFGSIHLYPEFWNLPASAGSTWIADHTRIARALGKPLLLGEFGASQNRAATFETWLATARAEGTAGALAWQVMCEVCAGMGDQFGITYPADGPTLAVLVANDGHPLPTSPAPEAALTLSLDRPAYRAGDTAEVRITLPAAAPRDVPVDIFVGVALPPYAGPALGCPGYDPIALVVGAGSGIEWRCLSSPPQTFHPAVAGGSLSALPARLPFAWRPGLPPGVYTFFVVVTRPGALADGRVDPGDVLAIATGGATLTE